MKRIYLSLGSNIGDREANLRKAVEQLASQDMRVLHTSRVYETEPMDYVDQAWFLNQVVEAETRLFEVSQQHVKQSVVSLEAILAESFDRLDDLHKDKKKIRGIPSGFKDLDDKLAGFQRSDLIVLAARPSMGKTAFTLNIAAHVGIEEKTPVAFFSLEMGAEQFT